MYWNRSAAEIAAAWQAEIDNKLEVGATATLTAGAPNSTLASTITLLGQQRSTVQRNDIATPQLVAGGNSAMWLGLLFAARPTGNGFHAPPPTHIYGGADEATYLALVELASTKTKPVDNESLSIQSALNTHFMPRLQPGVATSWEMLPFVEMGEPSPPLAPITPPDHQADWIAWGSMLLTVGLIVLAILI